jgi:hypothetical protein
VGLEALTLLNAGRMLRAKEVPIMLSRLLRFASLALAVALFPACNGDDGPTAPNSNCQALAGLWTVTVSNSCGQNFSDGVAVTQTGCDISGILGQGDGFSGHINGNEIEFTITSGCGAQTGTARIHSSTDVSGNYSGQITRQNCGCPVGPISGTFSMTR